ncbi:hypothetical protein EMCRGX_G008625 [Ephydatia muelleri]
MQKAPTSTSGYKDYFKEADVPAEKRGEELVSLLEDDAFRIVSQLGFIGSDEVEYDAVTTCLKEQFAPRGVELEWQRKLHSAYQERQETLLEFSERIRMLVDKAYPSWSTDRRLEMARQQFVHGVSSPSIQMRLLKKGPETLEAALELARQWESAELAQQSLRGEKQVQGSFATSEEQPQQPLLVQGAQSTVEELALQVQQLSQQLKSATLHINLFCMLSGFSSSMGDQEQQGISGVPSANQQDDSRQSASTAHQQTDPSVTLETLKAIMKRVAVEAIEESQRRTPASSLPPTTTTGKP